MQSTYLGKIYKLMLKICLKYKKKSPSSTAQNKKQKRKFLHKVEHLLHVLIIYCVFHVNYSFERELWFFLKEISNPSNFL